MRLVMSAGLLALWSGSAVAADIELVAPVETEPRDIVVDFGGGVQLQPEYPGSDQYEPAPWPIVALQFLRLPVFGEVVDGSEPLVSVYPSINVVGDRRESDAAVLRDVGDVDTAVELGAGVAVSKGPVRAFAEVRQGVTGHDGIVAEGGIDLVARAFDTVEFRAGPRISAASDDYMDRYFSVHQAAPFLPEFEADGGLKDAGIEAQAIYAITEDVRVHAKGEWKHFLDDAQDSPIVQAGDENQFVVGIGLTYRFGLDLY